MPSTGSTGNPTMHTKKDSTDNMIDKGKDKIIQKICHLFLRTYQTGLEQSVKVAILCFIMSIDCSKSVIRYLLITVDHT